MAIPIASNDPGTNVQKIALFDFLRGWSAMMVFFHHAAILGGGPGLLAGQLGSEAVNAFMMASGFLIYYQAISSKMYQGFKTKTGVLNFYIRRFFRIAPTYYLALLVALTFSEEFGQYRLTIQETLQSRATDMSRYFIENKGFNALAHLTFLFGFLPKFSFSNPLPDWSLGLEMQFYLFFPLIFRVMRQRFLFGLLAFGILMKLIVMATGYVAFIFPMPSFLPLKFHCFAVGMILAHLMTRPPQKQDWLIVAAGVCMLVLWNRNLIMPSLFLGSYLYLLQKKPFFPALNRFFDPIFSHKSSVFLADVSYSLYIFHLLIMLPWFGILLSGNKPGNLEWLCLTFPLLAIVVGFSYVVYRLVELPGIKLGKSFIK
ncbi:MAG TPA: acyltransferase [Catalimonadaceae bacterium]|nr:acyltransferase [Catalimonadaceae bacterium]